MKATMTYMRRLAEAGVARKIPKKYDDQTDFANGLCAFTTGSTSGLTFYEGAVKSGKNGPFEWTIAPIPQVLASGIPALDLYGASVSVPKTTPQKQLAAWLFIRWFSEPKQQAQWTKYSLYFPVRKAAEPLIKEVLDKNRNFAIAWNLLKTANLKSEPFFAGYDLVRDAINAAYGRIIDGADIDQTLADLEAQASKLFKDSAP
jgi:ABC-type glycerol-3-phosphate transport system substrate-binding protein